MNRLHPRHKTGRAYARLLETAGYLVAFFGSITGIVTMVQVGVLEGLSYLFPAIVSGIGLVVLGEVVIVLFNIEYNTSLIREAELTETPSARPPELREENRGRFS